MVAEFPVGEIGMNRASRLNRLNLGERLTPLIEQSCGAAT